MHILSVVANHIRTYGNVSISLSLFRQTVFIEGTDKKLTFFFDCLVCSVAFSVEESISVAPKDRPRVRYKLRLSSA